MPTVDRRVRFEEYGFDPDTGELLRGGVPVARLQEQPARVLDALISRANRLVTRDDLHRLLWPENSLVDADNGLNIAVNKIRLALDDSATEPRFVQTVPRRGYRFIAAVEPAVVAIGPAPAASIGPVLETSAHPPVAARWSRQARVVGGVLAALALSFVMLIAWSRPGGAVNIRSAAVMPFANLAGDQDLDYAVTGLTDTLATELGARGLHRVIAPEATAHYRGSNVSPVQAADELHADALILGTVVRDGASYAVNVRVVDRSGRQVWARRFLRASPMELTFSDDVATELMPALGLSPAAAPREARQIAPAARNAFLRGRYFWNLRTHDGMTAAVAHMTHAIELQRDYALAWAGLADVYATGSDVPSALFVPWPGVGQAGLRAAAEALRFDPSLGEAHAAIGKIRMMQWRWHDAEMELAEAVRLNPNDATARQWYGTLLARLRKCQGAIEQTAIGGEIDPITPIVNEAVGFALNVCGQPERAIPVFRRVLAMHPEFATTHMRMAGAYLHAGDVGSSLAEYREALRLRPDSCEVRARMVGALMAAGKAVDARSLATATIRDARRNDEAPNCIAVASANIGDVESAFAALDAVVAEHGAVDGLLVDLHLRPLHNDPRWRQLLDRIGLAPYDSENDAARQAATRYLR